MLLVSLISAFFLCLLLIPSVWAAICSDDLDAHEYGIMRVSSRESHTAHNTDQLQGCLFNHITGNPVRETGPPVCMAKLIMMRHRVRPHSIHLQQTLTKMYYRSTKQTPENEAPASRANPHALPVALPSERRIVHETSPGCGLGIRSVWGSNIINIDLISCLPCLEHSPFPIHTTYTLPLKFSTSHYFYTPGTVAVIY